MRVVVIANATRASAKDLETFPRPIWMTQYRGHAEALARQAVEHGFDRIICVGGDGTLNECVNGIGDSGIELALVPFGTGNDLARLLGLTRANALDGTSRALDVGELRIGNRTRRFLNIAEVGLGGRTIRNVETLPAWIPKPLKFVAGLALTLREHRNVRASVNERLGRYCNIVIANGRYYGGGMCPAPDARLDDGRFELICFGSLSLLEIAVQLPKIYRPKRIEHRKIVYSQADRVVIRSDEPLHIEADGDYQGCGSCEFRILPRAIRFVTSS